MSDPGEITIDSFDEDEMINEANNADVLAAESNANKVAQSSPAKTLVEMAAYRIDIQASKLDFLLKIMDDELITEVWQLNYLDSANWRDMGFPIGLVSSIRRLMHEKDTAARVGGHQDRNYGFKDSGGLLTSHTFHGMPSYSISMNSTSKQARNTDSTDDDLSATTEPETPMLSSGVPQKHSNSEGTSGRTNMRRISDITLSERLSNRIITSGMLMSPLPGQKQKLDHIASMASTRDQPPVFAPRRSSQHETHSPTRSPTRSTRSSSTRGQQIKKANMRTSMPPRPLRRPTLHDTQMTNNKFDIDDISDTESFAMESVEMLFAGSTKQGEEKADPNNSLAVVTGSIQGFRELLEEGADSTIDEVAENESKRSDDSNNDAPDPSTSTRSSALPYNARLLPHSR